MVIALVQQIVIMAVIMVIGFCLRKEGVIDKSGTSQFSDIVLYIVSPVIIVQSLMLDFTPEKLADALVCAALTTVIMLVTIGFTRIVFSDAQNVARFGVIFSNCGFMGIPLVQGALGEEYVFYLSVCNAVSTFIVWTYGVCLMARNRNAMSLKKVATNPCIIALVIGLLCFALSLRPPEIVDATMTTIADVNTGLVMIVLGSYLASADLRSVFHSRLIYETCALRLLVVPAILLVMLVFAPLSSPLVKLTVLVTLSTPAGSVTAMFAEKFGADYRLGSGIVAVSTLLSLVTMPICIIAGSTVL